MAVQMDWHEGFQIYGEHGSVIAQELPALVPPRQRGRVLLRPGTASTTDRSARTPTSGADRSKASRDSILDRRSPTRSERRRRPRRHAGDGRDRAVGRDRRRHRGDRPHLRRPRDPPRHLRQDVHPLLARSHARRCRRARHRRHPVQHGRHRRVLTAGRDPSGGRRAGPRRSGSQEPHHVRRVGDLQHGAPRSCCAIRRTGPARRPDRCLPHPGHARGDPVHRLTRPR